MRKKAKDVLRNSDYKDSVRERERAREIEREGIDR